MINIELLRELSQRETRQNQSSLLVRAGKLSEEQGELWQEILAFTDQPNCSASASGKAGAVAEETVDILINCFDILIELGLSDLAINSLVNVKARKWESKLDRT